MGTDARLLDAAWRTIETRIGAGCAIGDRELGAAIGCHERTARRAVLELILERGKPIASTIAAGGGYFVPATREEVERSCRTFRDRAFTSLKRQAALRDQSFVEATAQMLMEFMEEESRVQAKRREEDGDSGDVVLPRSVDVVAALVARLSSEPERYGPELEELQRRLAPVFVPRERMEKLRAAERLLHEALGTTCGPEAA